jgi:hypothetical protein
MVADFIFLAHGWKARSDIVARLDPALVAESGFIKVKSTLQLASSSYYHIFAAGDVNNVPVSLFRFPHRVFDRRDLALPSLFMLNCLSDSGGTYRC